MPTYKYDVGTDEYDSSDKARIPAWCDRVLTKGNNLRQIHYNTAPLKFSDHRPVFATFQCTITVVDDKKRDSISDELYQQRRAVVGDNTANTRAEDTEDEDLLGYESIEPGLPPASSDRRKWWLDGGLPVRSQVKPPGDGLVRNPDRSPNPFSASSEPDWVKVDRPQPPPSRAVSVRDRTASGTSSHENLSRRPTNPTRKLPPVWHGSPAQTSATRPPQRSLLDDPIDEPQPALPTRPTGQHQVSRKPAPPVPKKPSVLRAESPSNTRDEPPPPLPRRTNTLPSPVPSNGNVPLPPPARRSTMGLEKKAVKDDGGPPLPPRRGQVNLLDEEEDAGMKGWQPLRPT